MAWVHVTAGASGSGSGTVTYQIDANPGGTARSGTIAVAGKSFGVTQAGAANPNEITVTLPGSVPLTMVKIAAGTFQMGSPSTERPCSPTSSTPSPPTCATSPAGSSSTTAPAPSSPPAAPTSSSA